jgi:hypothetical protein
MQKFDQRQEVEFPSRDPQAPRARSRLRDWDGFRDAHRLSGSMDNAQQRSARRGIDVNRGLVSFDFSDQLLLLNSLAFLDLPGEDRTLGHLESLFRHDYVDCHFPMRLS